MSMLRTLKILIQQLGFNPRQTVNSLRSVPWYIRNYRLLKKDLQKTGQPFAVESFYPALEDRFDTAGSTPLHYFFLDLHVAGLINRNNPVHHVDIGSRLDGFVAHVAAFRKIEVFDFRPLTVPIPNVTFTRADLTQQDFPFADYCDSVSCLHAIEHFGLGRYGDPVDSEGHIKGLNNIYKLLKPGGTFYFATPVGPQRIEFDAHRVFSLAYLLSLFEKSYELVSFSWIDDQNKYFPSHKLTGQDIENNLNCRYGCGIFELRKL